MMLLRAYALSRRKHLSDSTRRQYHQRLQRNLDAILALALANKEGKRQRKRYAKVRAHLFTFLEKSEIDPDNNSSEHELQPTATYRKVTGGFRSNWVPDLYAGFRLVVATARRKGTGAHQAIKWVLQGKLFSHRLSSYFAERYARTPTVFFCFFFSNKRILTYRRYGVMSVGKQCGC